MSDSCVVYVNEVLYYYFSFIFHLFFTFFIIYLFYSFKVGTFDIASTQQISIQFERFIHIQWNPALRTPALYEQFRLSRQKAHIFSLKLTRFIRTSVNMDNGHFSVSRVTISHILSTPLYGHWLSAHCLFSLSQLCDNCRHCTGAPNENIVQNHLNIALLNVF